MTGKRQATSDLNHDNWDREEEPEDRGTFRKATEDEINSRVIKKAKRKVATGSCDAADGGSVSKSVFSGFSGFGKPATGATSAASPFSFLAKIPAATEAGTSLGGFANSSTATTSSTFSFGTPASSTEIPKTKISFGSSGVTAAAASTAAKTTGTTTSTFSFGSASTTTAKDDTKSTKDNSADFYAKLKGLNQAVSEWVKSHVDKNPLCILTPIFKDYEQYLKELEEEKSKATTAVTTEKKASTTTTANAGIETFKFSEANTKAATVTTAASTFSFSSSTATSPPSAESSTKTNGFSFGLKKPDETKDSKPASTAGFSFGLKASSNASSNAASATTAPSTGFSFGKPASTSDEGTAPKSFSFTSGGAPFSFGNIKPPEAPATTEANDDQDEEPPKNEFKQVVEEDAVYSKKCKVFVKKDGNFVDKGVGTLYLKPIESNGKTQLLVRADTNLGNILVNLILSSGIPSQRMGKNNVMLVCLPTPEIEKPTPMLLRVKTGEEADELLENIEKYKK